MTKESVAKDRHMLFHWKYWW